MSGQQAEIEGGKTEGVTPAVARAIEMFAQRAKAEYGDHLRKILLFGSRARRQATPDSDVDVAVVLDIVLDPGEDQNRLSDITYDVLVETGAEIQPWPVPEAQWDDPQSAPNPVLIREMQSDGIEISANHDNRAVLQGF